MSLKDLNVSVVKNYLTSIGGALTGVPVLILANFPNLPPKVQHLLATCVGIGAVMLGIVSKQWNNHSTQAEVRQATVEAAVEQVKPTVPSPTIKQ
jgi:hypothetical protein